MKKLGFFITLIVLGLSIVFLTHAQNKTVDVIEFEDGKAKTTQMTEDEAKSKYAPIGDPIRITVDKEGAKEGIDADRNYLDGLNFYQDGQYQKALEAFLAADKLMPGKPNLYNALAMAYNKIGDHDRALEYYQKALAINPNASEYLVNLAFYYYDLGKCDLALPYFKKAASLDSSMNNLSQYITECEKK